MSSYNNLISSYNNLITVIRQFSHTNIVIPSIISRLVDHQFTGGKVKSLKTDCYEREFMLFFR